MVVGEGLQEEIRRRKQVFQVPPYLSIFSLYLSFALSISFWLGEESYFERLLAKANRNIIWWTTGAQGLVSGNTAQGYFASFVTRRLHFFILGVCRRYFMVVCSSMFLLFCTMVVRSLSRAAGFKDLMHVLFFLVFLCACPYPCLIFDRSI